MLFLLLDSLSGYLKNLSDKVTPSNRIVWTLSFRFYNARMNLLENMEGSDRQEMYRDINDLRYEPRASASIES